MSDAYGSWTAYSLYYMRQYVHNIELDYHADTDLRLEMLQEAEERKAAEEAAAQEAAEKLAAEEKENADCACGSTCRLTAL